MMRNILYSIPLSAVLAMYALPSWAELGGAAAKDAVQIQAQSSVVVAEPTLNVFQAKLPSGTQIKEYTNAEGVVVGVSWQGPTLPDLKQLLGAHFDAFANRTTTTAGNHRNAEFHNDDVVVQSHGQLRAFSGRAYLPKLLPAGFNINQIQ